MNTSILTNEKRDTVQRIFNLQRAESLVLRKEPIRARMERLKKLRDWIHANRSRIQEAAYKDFRKPAMEVDAIEIFHVLNEIKLALKNLSEWTKPLKVDAPVTMLGTRSYIQYEPKGVCLIISPWNYPFSLAVGPMVSALAAGNTVILKPSENTPAVSLLLKEMVEEIFDQKNVAVFEGTAEVVQTLLQFPFDHIFFTGSSTVGKIIMKAAAEHLTSVTLELGGKSPCIVGANANIQEAAERIVVAKFVNNGQTCIAPDYVLVESSIEKKLTEAIIKKTQSLFGGRSKVFDRSEDYCRIVNDTHFTRLTELVSDAVNGGAKIEFEGKNNPSDRFFHPIILSNLGNDARMLEEEIFGPVLPIISFKNITEAISFINERPKPLALYIFSKSRTIRNAVLRETSAGGVCVNDCGLHFLHHGLPFGGVNHSGIGKSHGHYGFLAFSNEKPVLRQRSGLTSVQAFYPPYTKKSKVLMDWFLKLF